MRARMVQASAEHIPYLAAHMRAADRDEVWAWGQHRPAESLAISLDASPLAWTGMLDDEPVCMFGAGAASMLAPIATPWLLGTDRIEDIPRVFGRMSRVALGRMTMAFPALANWTDDRHTRSHVWLVWLGFALGEARPMGPFAMPFRPFAMRCSHV